MLRPSGYFNAKARKMRAFCAAVLDAGGIDALLAGDADEVRARLLALWGVGPETADAMTLYAGRKPTFVVDAYAYRLFERLGRPPGKRDYDTYRSYFLGKLGDDVWTLNQWHALIVRHGQQICGVVAAGRPDGRAFRERGGARSRAGGRGRRRCGGHGLATALARSTSRGTHRGDGRPRGRGAGRAAGARSVGRGHFACLGCSGGGRATD